MSGTNTNPNASNVSRTTSRDKSRGESSDTGSNMNATNATESNNNATGATKSTGTARKQIESIDGAVQDVMQIALRMVDSVSEEEARLRVDDARQQHPKASTEQLVSLLIQKKCVQVGAIGAVTSGASIVPGLGSIAALTVGAVADLSLSMKLQAELVLEIAALHEYEFAPQEKRQAILIAAGLGAGAERILARYGTEFGEEIAERFAERSLVKVVPFVGVIASAGLNVLITYLVGKRATDYFQLGPEAVGDWATNLRAISGIDERAVGQWISRSATASWQSICAGATAITSQIERTIRSLRRGETDVIVAEAVEIPIVNVDTTDTNENSVKNRNATDNADNHAE